MKLTSYNGIMEVIKLKNKIKQYRTQAKMTQQELAGKVNVSSRTIISLEKGQYNPSVLLAYKIAILFNTNIEDLCCLEENKKWEDKKYEDLQ